MKKVGEQFISEVDKNRAIVQYLWRIIVILSISLVVLAISFMSIKNTVKVKVELPGKLIYKYAPVVVAGINGSNEVYYKLWSRYIVNEVSNFKSTNIIKKMDLIKKMMSPRILALKNKKLNNFAKDIALNLVDQDFKITKIKIMNKKIKNDLIDQAAVKIDGFAKQTIGRKHFSKSCSYDLKFKFIEGVLYVENFGTNCF